MRQGVINDYQLLLLLSVGVQNAIGCRRLRIVAGHMLSTSCLHGRLPLADTKRFRGEPL
jgi:hypothetical protein